MIGKLFKRFLVFSRLDSLVAKLWHLWRWPMFFRLIPSPFYYNGQNRSVTRYGVKFRIRPSDLSQWFVFNDSDMRHFHAALRTINFDKEGIIVDAGANIGQFSLVMAKYIRQRNLDKRVIAFEPNPAVFSHLKKNLQLNKDLSGILNVYQIGLGASEEYMEMSIPRRNTGAGTLITNYYHENHDNYLVSIKTLDSMVRLPVDFIKIDVEGFEYFVLKGAINILQNYQPALYLETNSRQPFQQQMFELLSGLGYRYLLDSGKDFNPVTIAQIVKLEGLHNVLAIPQMPVQVHQTLSP